MEACIPEKPLIWHTQISGGGKQQPFSLEVRTEENNRFSYNDRRQERGRGEANCQAGSEKESFGERLHV